MAPELAQATAVAPKPKPNKQIFFFFKEEQGGFGELPVNTWRFGDSRVTGEGMEAPHSSPVPCPLHLSHLAVPEICTF